MKRFHVITVTFLAGLMCGAMVPNNAQASSTVSKSYAPSYVDGSSKIESVDPETCTIELDSGDVYEIGCDEVSDYHEGDLVMVTRSGYPVKVDD